MGMPIPAPPDPRRRWTADAVRTLHDASLTWQPDGAAAAFTLDLAAYFADVHDEAGDAPDAVPEA
jgi:hypothetical protein